MAKFYKWWLRYVLVYQNHFKIAWMFMNKEFKVVMIREILVEDKNKKMESKSTIDCKQPIDQKLVSWLELVRALTILGT